MKRRAARGMTLFVDVALMQLPFTLATLIAVFVAKNSTLPWWGTVPAMAVLASWGLLFGGLPYVYWRRGGELRVKVRE